VDTTPIETFAVDLPHGITLSCRAAGRPDAPLLLFLHGFPEAAFVWDDTLRHFADRYRCVAPNLRGFEASSSPAEVEAYRAKHLVADIVALIAQLGGPPQALKRLVIVNAPHPATFLREMQHNPAQQAASAYMNFLCRPDAEALLAQDDFQRLWHFFTTLMARSAPWLTGDLKARYRAVWCAGLRGGCNYYRASPLRPPTPDDDAVMRVAFAPEAVTVRVPTLVVWAEADVALPPALLDGLADFVPTLTVERVPGATHWIVHERPEWLAERIGRFIDREAGP
jgi:pimeloyl-ACP methyl ester carboxylesterase